MSSLEPKESNEGRLSLLAHSDALAGYIRVVGLVGSILVPLLLSFVGWTANRAYEAFENQRNEFVNLSVSVATLTAQRQALNDSLNQAWNEINKYDSRFNDHERRISRVEAVSPIAPLLRQTPQP